ncbi:unnamed protein product [Staurois parvus]|uniref:Uncharacterized protein n=1 Tax=Staurois parvus TaxID=386267 RepID=A0ABN9FDF6_9NEOB|nr:unnamed protein product [Staurois parvus]
MQMSAVDLRITAHFTHLGSHGAKNQSVEPQCGGGGSSNGRPYSTLLEPTSSVRRPESGTWQSVAMETAAMGGRTGTHDTLWTWPAEEAVQGPMAELRKQHKLKAIQKPMAELSLEKWDEPLEP